MRQYRLNRESILYIPRTPRGHRKSCRDEFETHSYYQFRPFGTMIAPRRKKMKPQPRFKALAGIFYRGYYAGISRRLLVFQSICGERRFASCRVRKTVKRSAHNPYSGLFGNSRQTRVSNLAIAPNMQLRIFSEKHFNPAFQIDRPQTPIFSFLRLFKLSSYICTGSMDINGRIAKKSRNGAALLWTYPAPGAPCARRQR